jgi:AcrR family transcriptional regulator
MADSPEVDDDLASERGSMKHRLVAEAARLFRTKGYGETTTRELAERMGLQKASLYHHMSTKEELLFQICIEALEHMNEAVESASAGYESAFDSLQHAIIAHIESALGDADMHATMLIEMRGLSDAHSESVRSGRRSYEARFRRLLEAAQREGRVRSDIDAKWMTLALMNLLNWTIFWYHPDEGMPPGDLAKILREIYLHGAVTGE